MNLEPGKYCFYVDETQDSAEHGGYVPSLVIMDDPGHYPMTGDPGKGQAPWVWGTLEQAKRICRERNQAAGIGESQAMEIIASSLRAQNIKERAGK